MIDELFDNKTIMWTQRMNTKRNRFSIFTYL